MSESERRWMSQLKQSELSFSDLFVLLRFSGADDGCPPALVRAIIFIQPTDSNDNLFQRHPNGHAQK